MARDDIQDEQRVEHDIRGQQQQDKSVSDSKRDEPASPKQYSGSIMDETIGKILEHQGKMQEKMLRTITEIACSR